VAKTSLKKTKTSLKKTKTTKKVTVSTMWTVVVTRNAEGQIAKLAPADRARVEKCLSRMREGGLSGFLAHSEHQGKALGDIRKVRVGVVRLLVSLDGDSFATVLGLGTRSAKSVVRGPSALVRLPDLPTPPAAKVPGCPVCTPTKVCGFHAKKGIK
jgi:mRNA-degrading endonuclease RelE of RelBE toxin-antitoxin system